MTNLTEGTVFVGFSENGHSFTMTVLTEGVPRGGFGENGHTSGGTPIVDVGYRTHMRSVHGRLLR